MRRADEPASGGRLSHSQVVLLVGAEGVVDVPLQVDGQVGDPEHRSGHMNQPLDQPAFTLQEKRDDEEEEGGRRPRLRPN